MKQKIKLFDPHVDDSEKNIIVKTLDSHFWASGSGVGNVKKFETSFHNYIKSKSCIAVNNGTSALNLALFSSPIKTRITGSLAAITFNGNMKNIATKIMAHPELLLGDVLTIIIEFRYQFCL